MKLVYFEMRKSWLKVPIVILIIFLTIINIYKIRCDFIVINNDTGSEDFIRNSKFGLYEDTLKGKVTNEKIEFIKNTSDSLSEEVKGFTFSKQYDENRYTGYVFGDYRLFDGTLKDIFRYIVQYPNISNSISNKAYENIAFYKEHNNIYESRKNNKIYNAYAGRKLDSFYLTQGSKVFFSYDFSCLLILLLIIVTACQSFSKEYESKMDILISTSSGMKSTVISKCISSIFFCGAISIYFSIIDLLTINYFYNLEGLTSPIYSLSSFATSPFTGSVLSIILYVLLVRFIIYVFLSFLVMLISYIFKKSIVSVIVSFIIFCGLIYAQEFYSNIFNPTQLLSIRKYISEFNCVNIFNYPVYTVNAGMFICIVYCILISSLLYFLNRRKNNAKT